MRCGQFCPDAFAQHPRILDNRPAFRSRGLSAIARRNVNPVDWLKEHVASSLREPSPPRSPLPLSAGGQESLLKSAAGEFC